MKRSLIFQEEYTLVIGVLSPKSRPMCHYFDLYSKSVIVMEKKQGFCFIPRRHISVRSAKLQSRQYNLCNVRVSKGIS